MLDKLFNFGAQTAEHLFNKQGHLLPMWVGVDEKGAHQPLLIPNFDDKDQVAEGVKTFLKQRKIVRYVSMLECWLYEGKEMPPELAAGKSLKNNPDRREAIHIFAEDREGNSISGRYYILRPEHGHPKLSKLKVDEKMARTEGRFVGMFD